MKHEIRIEGEQLILIPLEERHIEKIRNWRNKEEIRRWFICDKKISAEAQAIWYQEYLKKTNEYVFIIVEKETESEIGMLSLYNISLSMRTAEFGRFFIGDESARGKKYGKMAVQLLCYFAFSRLGLDKIMLEVFSENKVALRVYEESGFRECGFTLKSCKKLITMEGVANENS